ncbi:MAG: HNH endonuclease, partial [Acidimicrobiales bacterium]|nr:HNH endonuclease [Acidimicrobiales bacterium]
ELADVITDLVTSTEQAAVVAGRFIAFGENNACALTKGSKSMTPLLTSTCRVSRARVRQLRRAGLASERFPHFHRALMDGQITMSHIDVVQPVWRSVNSGEFAGAEAALVALAAECTPEEFKEYLDEWEAVANPDQHLDEFIKAQAEQHLLLQYDLNGNLHLTGTIGPVHAEPFAQTVANRAEPIKAENPDRFRSATAMDALVDLVLNPDGKYRAHLEVLMPDVSRPARIGTRDTTSDTTPVRVHRDLGFSARHYPRTARGTLIPPAVAQQLRATSQVRHHNVDRYGNLTTDTAAGRHFTTAQRRLIRLRDHRCRHTGCTSSANRCEVDHIRPWMHYGPTLIRNGQLLCSFHHRYKHRHDPGPHRTSLFDDSPISLE